MQTITEKVDGCSFNEMETCKSQKQSILKTLRSHRGIVPVPGQKLEHGTNMFFVVLRNMFVPFIQ